MNENHPEFNSKKDFLNFVTEYPFGVMTEDKFDIKLAEEILEEDHFGLEEVKKRNFGIYFSWKVKRTSC